MIGITLMLACPARHAVVGAEPRVDLAIGYEVDPNWPAKPADVAWASVPGVTVDDRDQVWLLTRGNPPVQVYDTQGRLLRSWGQEFFRRSHYIRIDREGNIWTTDVTRHLVQKFTPEGKPLLTLGTDGVAGDDEKHFNMPTDAAIAPNGDVFVSDGYGNARVVHFDKRGRFVKTWGKLGTKPGEFSLPHSIAIDSAQRLYVADRNNARVQVFKTDGTFLTEWRNIMVPWGIHITKKDEVWVCGSGPMRWPKDPSKPFGYPPRDQLIIRFDTDGRVRQLWTLPKGSDEGVKPGEVNWLHAVGIDSRGNLYAGDIKGQRAQKFVSLPAE
jgi:streptogramin lyase